MLPHAVQPCARQESEHSLRQTQHTLLYTLCLLILAYIWVERGEEIRQEPPHVKTDLVYIWLCYYFSFQKYCLDSLHSDRCELRIWAKYDSSCCSFWKGQSHNSLLSSPSLNSCFGTQFCYLHLPLRICFSSSSSNVSYRYSIHKNTKYTGQADSCDQPQFVSVYEHLLLLSISMSIYINLGWVHSLELGSTI